MILAYKILNVVLKQSIRPPQSTFASISLRTGPLTKRAARVIHFPGDEGDFVESKTVICRTDMRKGAWGRQYGEMRLALMRAGNQGGALKIYCPYRRHLFKPTATLKPEQPHPFRKSKLTS